MDSLDDSYSSQVISPNANDLKETYVESYTESLTPPFLCPTQFPKQGFLEDVEEYDDTALEDLLREAHRVHVYHSQREGLSVGQTSSSMSERTERLVGERTGRPVEPTGQDHRLELSWTDRNSKFSPTVKRKLRNTNTRLIKTGEVYEN